MIRMQFLSTPSGWRATVATYQATKSLLDFYPRPPGGGRLAPHISVHTASDFYPRPPGGGRLRVYETVTTDREISIHALRVEGDRRPYRFPTWPRKFLSTPSGWRATCQSTHYWQAEKNFYPRPPGGGRPLSGKTYRLALIFLSTPSGWRATHTFVNLNGASGFLSTPSGWRATFEQIAPMPNPTRISIHALRVEGDAQSIYFVAGVHYFYPRPPGGGRPKSKMLFYW